MKAINSVRLPKAEDICAPVEAVGGKLSICTLSGTSLFLHDPPDFATATVKCRSRTRGIRPEAGGLPHRNWSLNTCR